MVLHSYIFDALSVGPVLREPSRQNRCEHALVLGYRMITRY
jgi:hypothetical protein